MEIESKFKIPSPDSARGELARIGARFLSRELERDTYYAVPPGSRLTAVRLRARGEKGLFTVKARPDEGFARTPGIKALEETEVEVADAGRLARMLEMLGFIPLFRKEKVRESYIWRDVPLFLDELPFLGFYLEIEAPEDRIRETAEALSLDWSQASAETYLEIFTRYKTERGLPGLELVFSEAPTFSG
jgi:adenylate cyclase, class 2